MIWMVHCKCRQVDGHTDGVGRSGGQLLKHFYRIRKNLSELSRLGHFLKGSSAAIGLKKVKATCEKIQNYGNCKDETGSSDVSEADALKHITPLLPQVKAEYNEAEEYLKTFYDVQEAR